MAGSCLWFPTDERIDRMSYTITDLRIDLSVGDEIPLVQDGSGSEREMTDYEVGHWVEGKFYIFGLNHSKGPDLPSLGIEIKTYSEKTEDHTIGFISKNKLIKTPYSQSLISSKLQMQYRVGFNKGLRVVTSMKLYNFKDPHLQDKLRMGYEHGRKLVISGQAENYPSRLPAHPDGIGFFERRDRDRLQFRISDREMEFMMNYHKSKSIAGQFLI
jgi:hypothetical protein